MQASPLLLGFSLWPATFWITPSSTLMDNPQPTPQKPQMVVSSRAPLTLPFSVAVTIALGSPLLVPNFLNARILTSIAWIAQHDHHLKLLNSRLTHTWHQINIRP